jgi:hypothetical protein
MRPALLGLAASSVFVVGAAFLAVKSIFNGSRR